MAKTPPDESHETHPGAFDGISLCYWGMRRNPSNIVGGRSSSQTGPLPLHPRTASVAAGLWTGETRLGADHTAFLECRIPRRLAPWPQQSLWSQLPPSTAAASSSPDQSISQGLTALSPWPEINRVILWSWGVGFVEPSSQPTSRHGRLHRFRSDGAIRVWRHAPEDFHPLERLHAVLHHVPQAGPLPRQDKWRFLHL